MPPDSTPVTERRISTDGETIRKWADRHDAVPVRGSSDGTLDLVHESRVGAEHERLDWATFDDEFDAENNAVSYRVDGRDAPLGVMTREEAVSQSDVEDKQVRDRLIRGETVVSAVRETSGGGTGATGDTTVESELVRREIVHEELLNVDLVERICTGFSIVSNDEFMDADTFDHDRYFAMLEASRGDGSRSTDRESGIEPSSPYTARDRYQMRIDVREVWRPTREITERFTVQSRITGTGATGGETLADHDVDVDELQRSIVEQGILDAEHEPEKVMRDFGVESELGKGDRIHTHFTRTSVVEDEVVYRTRVFADTVSAEFIEMEMDFTAVDHVVSEEATETMDVGDEAVALTSDDVGKDVVDATGSTIGTVRNVTDGGRTANVDPDSSATDDVVSSLNGNDGDDPGMEIYTGQFERVTDEEIRLKEYEHLAEPRRRHESD